MAVKSRLAGSLPARLLFRAALSCLMLAALSGLLAGVAAVAPERFSDFSPYRGLRPFHTVFALGWIFLGQAAAIFAFTGRSDALGKRLEWGGALLLAVFLASAIRHGLMGIYSGETLLSWPAMDSWILFAAFLTQAVVVWRGRDEIQARSPEAAWLLLLGVTLLPAGLMEHLVYLGASWAWNPGSGLPVEWQAVDTIITGWCVVLYGIAILAVPRNAKPLRSRSLFAVAILGILLDFGHHNYQSPEARILKALAFGASLLALVSVLRHLRAFRRTAVVGDGHAPFYRWIEIWTLIATAGGLLMAVPWLNAVIHGTYAVAAHTMGAVIGVNSFILLAVGYADREPGPGAGRALQIAAWSLVGLVLMMTVQGVAEGLLRSGGDYFSWINRMRSSYVLWFVFGVPMAAALGYLAVDQWGSIGKADVSS